ncbi:MAG: hypothetical protein NT029_19450 [Armatimonadetes bacterium]|nr:hypothetical protein [Armatimonadota bacterium]
MSISRNRKAPLRVTAAEEATEIFVIDSSLSRVASGMGSLDVQVRPGIYKVRLRSGASMEDTLVEVQEGDGATVAARPIAFQSAAPLPGTLTTHEPHQAAWARAADPPSLHWGSGASLFVMVRDPSIVRGKESRTEPWAGITVQDAEGRTLGAMDKEGERMQEVGVGWLHAEADPGMHLICVDTGLSGVQCMAVHLCPGWQTQVILSTASVRRSAPAGEGDADAAPKQRSVRRAALTEAAIYYGRPGGARDPAQSQELLRLTELVRQGLAQGRPTAPLAEVKSGRWITTDNPMLALLTAYVEAAKPKPDARLLRSLAKELAAELPGHPDVLALQVLAGGGIAPKRKGVSAIPYASGWVAPNPSGPSGRPWLLQPPMLAAALSALLQAMDPAPGSLVQRIQESLLPGAPWLVWRRTAAVRMRSAQSAR